jgi:cytosine permease
VLKSDFAFFMEDDYARKPVPLAVKRSWLPIAIVWFGLGTDIAAALYGTIIASGQTVFNGLIALLIANLILGVIGGFAAYIGSITGLSTGMITRFTFGQSGGKFITFIITLVFFSLFGVILGLFGETTTFLFAEAFQLNIPVMWATIAGGVLMIGTAAVGYVALERLSMIAVPLMFFLFGGLIAKVWAAEGTDWLFALPENGMTMSIGSAVSFIMATWMMVVVITPDLSRYAKTPRDAFFSAFFGFLVGNSVMISLAMMLSRITGVDDVIQVMLSVGWGIWAMLILILAQWTTNDNILYSTGLALSSLIRHVPKTVLTVIAGIIGILIAVFKLHENILPFMSIVGAVCAPIVAIYIVDYFFLDKTKYHFAFIQEKKVAPIYWSSVLVWGIATTVGLLTTPTAEGGWGLFQLTTASSIDAFLVAAILHYLLGKGMQRQSRVTEGKRVA